MNAATLTPLALALIFGAFLGLTVAGALIAVISRRIIRGVCGLALCSIGLAGVYYFLNSPFLALMQVLIYVGAVCVTIIFAVMLAEPDEPASLPGRPVRWAWELVALLVSAGLFAGISWLATGPVFPAVTVRVGDGSLKALGIALLTTYSLVFEVISLVLLVGIIGALAIAHDGRGGQR